MITPEIIESAGADIREGDILILHTGWHKHYEGQSQQDLVRYFCYHPGPSLETLALDVQEEDQVVGHGHRLLRPRHEHLDPLHAAGSRRGVHQEARQDAGRILRHVRVHAQEVRPQGFGRRVSVPQLGVPGRAAARREPRRRYRADAQQARASSARSPGATRGSKAARAASSPSSTAARTSRRSATPPRRSWAPERSRPRRSGFGRGTLECRHRSIWTPATSSTSILAAPSSRRMRTGTWPNGRGGRRSTCWARASRRWWSAATPTCTRCSRIRRRSPRRCRAAPAGSSSTRSWTRNS